MLVSGSVYSQSDVCFNESHMVENRTGIPAVAEIEISHDGCFFVTMSFFHEPKPPTERSKMLQPYC